MARWWGAGSRLRLSLRLLARLVAAVETQAASQIELTAQVTRVAEALEVWNMRLADGEGPGVEDELPPLDVLQRLSAQAPTVRLAADPRSFRTAPPTSASTPPAPEDPTAGGVSYRDPWLLARAAAVEQTLRAALGRDPSDQELTDALAVEEGQA